MGCNMNVVLDTEVTKRNDHWLQMEDGRTAVRRYNAIAAARTLHRMLTVKVASLPFCDTMFAGGLDCPPPDLGVVRPFKTGR